MSDIKRHYIQIIGDLDGDFAPSNSVNPLVSPQKIVKPSNVVKNVTQPITQSGAALNAGVQVAMPILSPLTGGVASKIKSAVDPLRSGIKGGNALAFVGFAVWGVTEIAAIVQRFIAKEKAEAEKENQYDMLKIKLGILNVNNTTISKNIFGRISYKENR